MKSTDSIHASGCFLVVVVALINFRYLIFDIGPSIAFFNSIYDPLANIFYKNFFSNTSSLLPCDINFINETNTNNTNYCTLTDYKLHVPWAIRFYTRFASNNNESFTRRIYLYSHLTCNTHLV